MTDLRSHTSADRIVLERRMDDGWVTMLSDTYAHPARATFLDLARDYSALAPNTEFRVVRRTVRVTDEVIA